MSFHIILFCTLLVFECSFDSHVEMNVQTNWPRELLSLVKSDRVVELQVALGTMVLLLMQWTVRYHLLCTNDSKAYSLVGCIAGRVHSGGETGGI